MAVGGEMIIGPALAVIGVLAGLALGVDTVNHLEPVTVTARMEEQGLSSHVVTERLVTRIAQVADIDTEFHEVRVKDIAGKGFVEILAEALHLEDVVIAARKLPGAIEVEFSPEFVERNGQTVLHLRIVRPQTGVRMVQDFAVEGDLFDPALRQATRVILGIVDPIALVIDDMRQGDYLGARHSLQRAARAVPDELRHVADTLHGLQLLREGDALRADSHLRLALLRQPHFAPAQLALAIAAARGGRDGEAHRVLDALDDQSASWTPRARREVPAAAAFVRARLAAANGRWNEALPALRSAVGSVPNFAEAHRALAETYRALGMTPLAEHHEHLADRLMAPDVPRYDDRLDSLLHLVVAAIMPPGQPAAPPSAAETAPAMKI